MTNIFKLISDSTLEVINTNGDLVGYSFVINFVNEEKNNSVRPFLIVNKEILESNELLSVSFDSINNGKNEKHRINFSKDFIANFEIEGSGIVALPLAQTLNGLSKKGVTIQLNGFPDSLIPDDKGMHSLNEVNEFTWFSYDNVLKTMICNQGKNVTLIGDKFDTYIKTKQDCNGAPAFIVNIGAFAVDNSINVGTRILFYGYFGPSVNGYSKVFSAIELSRSIKKKFDFE